MENKITVIYYNNGNGVIQERVPVPIHNSFALAVIYDDKQKNIDYLEHVNILPNPLLNK